MHLIVFLVSLCTLTARAQGTDPIAESAAIINLLIPPEFGQAIYFEVENNKIGPYIDLGDIDLLQQGDQNSDFTIEMWIFTSVCCGIKLLE